MWRILACVCGVILILIVTGDWQRKPSGWIEATKKSLRAHTPSRRLSLTEGATHFLPKISFQWFWFCRTFKSRRITAPIDLRVSQNQRLPRRESSLLVHGTRRWEKQEIKTAINNVERLRSCLHLLLQCRKFWVWWTAGGSSYQH